MEERSRAPSKRKQKTSTQKAGTEEAKVRAAPDRPAVERATATTSRRPAAERRSARAKGETPDEAKATRRGSSKAKGGADASSVVVDRYMETAATGKRVLLENPEDLPGATKEALEPFLRAVESLLRGLGDVVGETGQKGRIEVGSLLIDFDDLGWGDDTIRVRRLTSASGSGQPSEGTRSFREPALQATEEFRHGDLWEQGMTASREGASSDALSLFEAEASRSAEASQYQRAAIAYRSASREAMRVGRHDHANKLLRLAGKHYLMVGESAETPVRAVGAAFVAAAKCFLQAGNLRLASASLNRALAANEVLSDIADDADTA